MNMLGGVVVAVVVLIPVVVVVVVVVSSVGVYPVARTMMRVMSYHVRSRVWWYLLRARL